MTLARAEYAILEQSAEYSLDTNDAGELAMFLQDEVVEMVQQRHRRAMLIVREARRGGAAELTPPNLRYPRMILDLQGSHLPKDIKSTPDEMRYPSRDRVTAGCASTSSKIV
jgi:hypothetical protein